jgi:general secretion pathway protein D
VVFATPAEYNVVHSALRQLDTAPMQVFLEAAIAEITLTNNLHFGVQYFSQPNAQNQLVLTTGSGASITASYPGFSYMFLNGNTIQATLSALSTVTKVDVISSPELMVLNNQTATLEVGDRVPIETQQAISTITSTPQIVNSIEYEDTGVILKLTPRVNRGGVVMMDISQEVSDVTSTTSSTLNSPTIEERKITSSVAVQDGQTVALGGLISSNKSNTRGGIPGLSAIPVIGALFADTENDFTKTELMVLITPHVVDNVDKARAITDELRRKLPAVESLVETTH